MPISWIPFRGDNYSKEGSKRYIPKTTSDFAGVFGAIVVTGIVISTTIALIFDAVTTKGSNSIFALSIILVIVVIALVAIMDARTINSRKRQ